MAYFPDLSPCTYFQQHGVLDGLAPLLLAVGWLDPHHLFSTGDPGITVFEKLQQFRRRKSMDGFAAFTHPCGFCRYPTAFSAQNLFIPGTGVTYVAPEGIVHYIGTHDYRPPDEFCEAVLQSQKPDSPEFLARLQELGWSEELVSNMPYL